MPVKVIGLEQPTALPVESRDIPLKTWFTGQLSTRKVTQLFYVPFRCNYENESNNGVIKLISFPQEEVWAGYHTISDYKSVDVEIIIKGGEKK